MSPSTARRPGAGLSRMVAALIRQRRRLALASVAIALSVGYLAGALSLLDRVSGGLDDMAAAATEHADLVVEGEVAYESAIEQTRRLVPASLAESIATVPGVASVSARFEEITMILGSDGHPVVAPGLSEQPLGTNWPDDDEMSPFEFVGNGRPPQDGEVVLDERSAREAGVEVGDTVMVVSRFLPEPYVVSGIVTTERGELPEGSSLALFDTETARQMFASGDNANRIAIRVEDGVDPADVAATLAPLIPQGAELVDLATAIEHRQEGLTRSFTLIRVLILGFAGLALAVGMGTVANSLTLLYSERRRTFASLRLVGARPRQLLGAALIEAAMLAAVASAIGAPLGVVLGWVIEKALGSLGTAVPVGGGAVSVPALLTALAIGIAATVLAAVVPATRAGRVPPIEAISEISTHHGEPSWRRALNVVIASVGVAAVVVGLAALADVDLRIGLLVGAAIVVIVAVAVTFPAVLASAVSLGIRIAPASSTTLRRIGSRDALRNRSRTAATTAALLIATAVVAAIAVFLSSFTRSVEGDVAGLVRSDLVVDSGTFSRGGLSAELVKELRALEGTEGVSGWQLGRVWISDAPIRLTGVDGASVEQVMDPNWVEGSSPVIAEDAIALSEDAAAHLGVGIGDTVPVLFFSQGTEDLRVDGIYRSGTMLLGDAMIDRATLMRAIPASVDLAALVALDPEDADARTSVEELAASYGVTSVVTPDEFVASRSALLTGFERVIQWMLLFTLVQALIGVINTLLMSVGERRREFGLLRIAGASPRQIRAMVLNEGLSFAVVGTGLGLALGIGIAAAAVRALHGLGVTSLAVPVAVLVVTALTATALGVAAAVVPARWAAAVPPLEAVADTGTLPVRGPVRLWARMSRRGTTPSRTESEPSVDVAEPVFPATPPPFRGVAPPPVAAAAATIEAPAAPPVEAVPVETAPIETVPTETVPTEAVPVEPAPTEPAPTEPTPIYTGPVQDEPAVAAAAATGWLRSEPTSPQPDVAADRVLFEPVAAAEAHQRGRPAQLDPAAALRLGGAVELLDPTDAPAATYALTAFARSLEPDEQVESMVQGWARGLVCLVARTNQRIVVVVDRFPAASVESLDLSHTRLSVFGPPGSRRVSVSLLDGRRLLEVTGIANRDQAEALCRGGAVPAPTADTGRRTRGARRKRPEYF